MLVVGVLIRVDERIADSGVVSWLFSLVKGEIELGAAGVSRVIWGRGVERPWVLKRAGRFFLVCFGFVLVCTEFSGGFSSWIMNFS